MHRAVPFLALLLAACGSEADFDRRYVETERRIADKAAAMEHDLQARDSTSDPQDK